jgi:hypothetical protein
MSISSKNVVSKIIIIIEIKVINPSSHLIAHLFLSKMENIPYIIQSPRIY